MSEAFILCVHLLAAILAVACVIDCAMKRNMPAVGGWLCTALWASGGALRYV